MHESEYHGYKIAYVDAKKLLYDDEVSECISEFVRAGKSQEQAVAACLEIERQKKK